MNKITKSINLGGRELKLETGELASQAGCAVLAQYGETVVLATVTSSPLKEDKGYFPLSIEYQERLYAGGRIKGSRWVKRDGRPSDVEILAGRVIDRSIRPLFSETFQAEVQVIVTVMSVDMETNPVDLAPIAVAAAIEASTLPWSGPVSVLRMGYIDGKYVLNPTNEQSDKSEMDLIVSNTKSAIVMIEAGANQVSEEVVLGGVDFAIKESKAVFKLIADFAKEVGNTKEVLEEKGFDKELKSKIEKLVTESAAKAVKNFKDQKSIFAEFDEIKTKALAELSEEDDVKQADSIIEKIFKQEIRKVILSGSRLDGRKHTEIRTLSSRVGVLPRTHGTGLFTRGSTQALSVTTLGSPSNTLLLESAEGETEKRYIHHYSMPPFSTGETGRVGSPSRREIGHGALAERALVPVLPDQKDFPYTIQVVSEVLSSNGSTSMASTCGSTLSLMDAGVPIKAPVSGIAMGLIIEDKTVAILSDIMGIEDFNGDMDFKVAGTSEGITAMQMDVKTLMLTPEILKTAIAQAKIGRAFILDSMIATISEPRKEISKYAPMIVSIKIDPARIGEIIGPGGKTIKGIIADTGADVNVEDDGTINISGVNAESVEKAKQTIVNMTKEIVPGEIYEGTVVRMQSFGAFVEILPGKDGLVHVSDMSDEFVSNPEDIVNIGDKVTVRVKEVDQMGRINLSLKLDPSSDVKRENGGDRGGDRGGLRSGGDRGNSRSGGSSFGRRSFDRGNDRGPRRDSRGGDSRSGGNRRFSQPPRDRQDRASGGPHFPTSRLVSTPEKGRR